MSHFIEFSTVEGNNYPNFGKYLLPQNISMFFDYVFLYPNLPKYRIISCSSIITMFKSELYLSTINYQVKIERIMS